MTFQQLTYYLTAIEHGTLARAGVGDMLSARSTVQRLGYGDWLGRASPPRSARPADAFGEVPCAGLWGARIGPGLDGWTFSRMLRPA